LLALAHLAREARVADARGEGLVEEDVRALDVLVHETRDLVQVGEAARDAERDARAHGRRQRDGRRRRQRAAATERVVERAVAHEGENEARRQRAARPAVGRAAEEGQHVRVRAAAERAPLALKRGGRRRAVRAAVRHLDRDGRRGRAGREGEQAIEDRAKGAAAEQAAARRVCASERRGGDGGARARGDRLVSARRCGGEGDGKRGLYQTRRTPP
jgi:hypothetical protein